MDRSLRQTTWLGAALAAIVITLAPAPSALLDAGAAPAQKPAAAQSSMYTQGPEGSSAILGASGVPVYVTIKSGARRGLYLTRVGQDGVWRQMGLMPGDVLLTLDNRVVRSATDAEGYLRDMQPHSMDINFLRKSGDQLEMKATRFAYGGAASVSTSALPAAPSARFKAATTITGNGVVSNKTSIGSLEQYMLELVNNDRRNVGKVNALSMNSTLSTAARNYAQDMLKRNFFSHSDPSGRGTQERAKDAGIKCGIYENLSFQQGRGFRSDEQMVAAAEAEMMSEPPEGPNHRTNILHPAHGYAGIGIARDGNTIMMVQWYTDAQP